jgi:hypothetical protein
MSRIERAGEGFTVDAAVLAQAFAIAAADVPGLLRDGQITSLCETGTDADAGRFRLTFYHRGRALRLTVDADGRILSQARFDTPGRAAAPRRPAQA